MKLGSLPTRLPQRGLEDVAAWAAANAFEASEVAAWPARGHRPFTAKRLDVNGFGQRHADDVSALFDQHRLALSSLTSTTTTCTSTRPNAKPSTPTSWRSPT